jgi:hypothetical protein
MAQCYRQYDDSGTGDRVYDLSGNVKEWTEARSSGVNPIRGGAMDSTAGGSRCDFDFTVADDNYLFKNLGFRCCY